MKEKKIVWALWGAYGVLIGLWAFRLWNHFPAFMDTMEYVFPEKWFNVESYQKGRVALWNPYIACGTPHLAAFQPAVFYPLFWVWNFLGLTHWFFMAALAHEIIAAAGFYFWLKALKVSPLTATLCAMGFAGSALMVFYWGFPTHLASVAWVPWVFGAGVKLLEKPSLKRGLWASLLWALQILSGYPFFTFYALLFWGLYCAIRSKSLSPLWIQGAAFAAGLTLSACQWLPFLDYLGYMHRVGWGDQLYSLNWKNMATLFSPEILGFPGTPGYQGDYPSYIFDNLYLGLVPLGIWLWSFFSPYAKNRFWNVSSVVWLLWLAGIHFPLWRLLPEKLMDRLEPTKACFLFVFCAFTAIALGLKEKIKATSKKNIFWKWAWVGGALWVLDLMLVPSRILQTVPDPYQDSAVRQSSAKALEQSAGGRFVTLTESGKLSPGLGLEGSMEQKAMALAPNTNLVWGLKSAQGYLTLDVDGYQNLAAYLQKGFPYDGRILDAAGVKLILSPLPLTAFKYGIREKQGDLFWVRNAGALNRVWQVERAREYPDRPAVFTALLDPRAFLEEEVYTEKSPQGGAVLLPAVSRILYDYSPGLLGKLKQFIATLLPPPPSIQEKSPSPCEAEYEVVSSRGGFLVFNETFCPGWHLWVDGHPKPIFRADGLWMAAPLPNGGEHQVLFRYEPSAFRLGLFFTLISLALGFGAFLLSRSLFYFYPP